MSDPKRDPLDEALASVPREVRPERDLWPAIRAQIDETLVATPSARAADRRMQSRWLQLAAGVLLIIGTSVTTYLVTRESMQQQVAKTPATVPVQMPAATPASFGFGQETLGADYLKARDDLDKVFQERLAALPPGARTKVERNLADLRHAANELSTTLSRHPSDPLLQELLISTYRRELQLLADVSELPATTPVRTDL
ncbi:MAG: hypothetical protein ACREUC_13875 [Steroidobacteraceae bacterium]